MKLAYKRTFYGNKDATRVVFFFCAYGTKHWMYKLFFRKFLRSDTAVYAYDFAIKSWNGVTYDEMVRLVNAVIDDAQAEIASLKTANPKRVFYAYGVSMGSVMAMRLAKQSKDIQKVVLNTVYGSSAKQIWDHKSLGWTQKHLEDAGKDWKILSEETAHIEPYKNVDQLKGKDILILYSTADKTHLAANTELLLRALDERKVPYTLVKGTKWGHKRFILDNLRHSQTDEFLLK
jgi:hypothetical protein